MIGVSRGIPWPLYEPKGHGIEKHKEARYSSCKDPMSSSEQKRVGFSELGRKGLRQQEDHFIKGRAEKPQAVIDAEP